MSEQILFFKKSKSDFSFGNVVGTASQGVGYEHYLFNRSNSSAWVTSGSVDADNTTLIVDFGEARDVSDILLIKHNFKSYTIKYWNGTTYTNFSTTIAPTTNTLATTRHEFTTVNTQLIKITILGTQTANADKYLYQFIAAEKIGQLAGWPIISKPSLSRNRRSTEMLSGKMNIAENVGKASFTLKFKQFSSDADLTIVENLYNYSDGFLVWLSGGDQSQFRTVRQGYRLEDIYLMKCSTDYKPEYYEGLYKAGLSFDMTLEEVVD